MPDYPLPDFLQGTFHWDARGLALATAPNVELMSNQALSSDNPWVRLAAILQRAKIGVWAALRELERMIVTADHPLLRTACAELFGYASPESHIRSFVPTLLPLSEELRVAASQIIYCAGPLRMIPLAIEAWRLVSWPDSRDEISCMLSDMLEPNAGDVFSFESAPDHESYTRHVNNRVRQLAEALGKDSVPVWKGEVFGVIPLSRKMREMLISPSPGPPSVEMELLEYRQRFECATGIDCSAFFKDRELQPLAALAIVESFLESPDAAKYEDGVRYFFGHRIPD